MREYSLDCASVVLMETKSLIAILQRAFRLASFVNWKPCGSNVHCSIVAGIGMAVSLFPDAEWKVSNCHINAWCLSNAR